LTTTVGGTAASHDLIIDSPCLDRILCNYGFDRIMGSRCNRLTYNPGLDPDRIHDSYGRGLIRKSPVHVCITNSSGRIAGSPGRDHITNRYVCERITDNPGHVRMRSITGRGHMRYNHDRDRTRRSHGHDR